MKGLKSQQRGLPAADDSQEGPSCHRTKAKQCTNCCNFRRQERQTCPAYFISCVDIYMAAECSLYILKIIIAGAIDEKIYELIV